MTTSLEKQNPAGGPGSGSAGGQVSETNDSTNRRLRAVIAMLALESRIALNVARDVHLTGGCEVEDGRRLATAVKRLAWACKFVTEAEREVANSTFVEMREVGQ